MTTGQAEYGRGCIQQGAVLAVIPPSADGKHHGLLWMVSCCGTGCVMHDAEVVDLAVTGAKHIGVRRARCQDDVCHVETGAVAAILPLPVGGHFAPSNRGEPGDHTGMRNHDERNAEPQVAGLRGQVEVDQVYGVPADEVAQQCGNAIKFGFVGGGPVERRIEPNELSQPLGLGPLDWRGPGTKAGKGEGVSMTCQPGGQVHCVPPHPAHGIHRNENTTLTAPSRHGGDIHVCRADHALTRWLASGALAWPLASQLARSRSPSRQPMLAFQPSSASSRLVSATK